MFFIAGFSDALDGFLAKRFCWESRLGSILDPLADKALLILTMVILAINGHLSWWLFALVAFRDIYIVIGAYYYHRQAGPYSMQPSGLSKLNTFVQLLLVTSILVSLGLISLPQWYIDTLVYLTYFTTLSSGIHYTWLWSKKLKKHLQQSDRQAT